MHSSQTLPLIFELVNITNGIDFKKQKDEKDKIIKIENGQEIINDETGEETIKCLKNC